MSVFNAIPPQMPSQADLLNTLFSAAGGLPDAAGWAQFLTLLGTETRAQRVRLQIDRQGHRMRGWDWAADSPPPPAHAPDTHRMRSHRIYSQTDLPGAEGAPHPLRAMKAPLGSAAGDHALILLQRQGDDFRAIDGVLLSSLVPYLAPALNQWAALARERQHMQLSQHLMRDLGAGWVILSPHGLLIDIDPALRTPLDRTGGIRFGPDGRPGFRDETTAQALRQALSAAQAGTAPAPLRLSDDPLMEMVLTVWQPDPADPPLLLGRVRHARNAQDLPLSRITHHFGLSPSEARLACLLCDGHSLTTAADRLGWTIETARSTSKQVFARMGVRGQAGVIRRMQASALWLAPAPS